MFNSTFLLTKELGSKLYRNRAYHGERFARVDSADSAKRHTSDVVDIEKVFEVESNPPIVSAVKNTGIG